MKKANKTIKPPSMVWVNISLVFAILIVGAIIAVLIQGFYILKALSQLSG